MELEPMTAKIPSFRLHQETLDDLKVVADKHGLTVPAYIRMIMMQHLETIKKDA